jgi:hypothetical protein
MVITTLTDSMIREVLSNERYTLRFEDFCIDLMSEARGVDYLRTSRSYDLGKDGRGVQIHRDSAPPVICCGTDGNPVAKAKADLDTLLNTIEPPSIVFCFTAPVSEHAGNLITQDALRRGKQTQTVEVFGVEQLSQLIVRYPHSFETHYAAELANLRQALAVPSSPTASIELTGLRIALTTQLHDDAQRHRSDIIQNLILTTLSDGQCKTAAAIAKSASDTLSLPRKVKETWLTHDLNKLVSDGAIVLSADGRAFTITEVGVNALNRRSEEGVNRLAAGQTAIRAGLEKLLGFQLGDTEFQPVWKLLQNGLVTLFLAHGAQLVQSLASFLEGDQRDALTDDLRTRIDNLTAALNTTPRSREISQALNDLFSDRTSEAFGWLTDLADVFLQLCSLGLEPASQQQMVKRLQELDLILDTDVVLSLLAAGESNHEAIGAMVRGWRQLGGRLYVTAAVLEEVAHHAEIAAFDYENTESILDKIDDAGSHTLIGNAFVRGYWREARDLQQAFSRSRWNAYIRAFKGATEQDLSKVRLLLKEDYEIEFLSESSEDREHAVEWANRLYEERRRERDSHPWQSLSALREKCNRDGRLAAIYARHANQMKESGCSVAFVSTSRALRSAIAAALGKRTGADAVMYSTAIVWLLSQVPGVAMTESMLRTVMFDVDFPAHLHPLERKALRLFCASEEYTVHFSRRGALRDAMRAQIHKRALQIGEKEPQIVERMIQPRTQVDSELTSEILAAAVDEIAISKSESRIRELEAELARLKARR